MTATVITGDCLDVMRTLAPGSVDAIVTDPPYNYGKKYGDGGNDEMEPEVFKAWLEERFRAAATLLRDGGSVYFTCSTQMMSTCEAWDFLRFRQWLIWHRPNLVNVHARSDWKQTWEPIYYGGKGSFRARMGVFPDSAVFTVATPQTNFAEGRFHVCQRPVKLIRLILARMDGDLILDPFCGSGTTGVACVLEGRDFLGIERTEAYVAIARRRIAEAEAQGVLL